MVEYINKWAVVNKLTALENEFQQFKPFEGFEHAMYRKLCEVEMEIGKMPAAETVQRWISVTERLPEYDGRYICNVKSFAFPGTFFRKELRFEHREWAGDYEVTHWMPLPEVPKEADGL